MWRPGRSRRAVNRPLTALAARVSADGPSGRSAADGFMEPSGIGMAGLGIAGLSTLGAFGLAFRQRRRRLRAGAALPATREPRSAADRLEALGQAQAELGLRLDALAAKAGAPEERLQAMAGQLVGLIRDKNATLETALAGLDQLRARMRALEQMGEPAEARALVDGLGRPARRARRRPRPGSRRGSRRSPRRAEGAALAERLTGLEEKRTAGLEATLARLAPLEAKLAALESGRDGEAAAGREALKRLETKLEAQAAEASAAKSELAALKAEAGGVRALGEQLTRVLAQKEALADTLVARVAAVEAVLAEKDPAPALARLAERLAALESRREPVRGDLRAADPALRPEGRDGRDGVRPAGAAGGEAGRARPDGRRSTASPSGWRRCRAGWRRSRRAENPFAEISEQLTRLYAQKDATVETVFARLAPLEARLAALDPTAALDRFAERLEAVQGRVAALEGAENPFAEISEQLTRLYAQKDATVETVFARLAPLEARLAALDPTAALDRFAERLEAVQGRLAALEGAENPFAEISEQLARLYAQKDATVETVFARLAPLEAKLAALDPTAALDRFAERLEAVQGRVAAIERRREPVRGDLGAADPALRPEGCDGGDGVRPAGAAGGAAARRSTRRRRSTASPSGWRRCRAGWRRSRGAENPFAEISEQLTRLYAQKDATVETVFARLAPMEARLAALGQGLDRLAPLAEDDPRAALDGLKLRLEALHWAQGETAAGLAALRAAAEARDGEDGALAGIADRLTRLFAQKDAGLAAILARLGPLEARLAALEADLPAAEAARAEARAAAEMIAAEAADAATALFADRIAGLEARLPRVAAPRPASAADELEAILALPGLVSLHRKAPAAGGR